MCALRRMFHGIEVLNGVHVHVSKQPTKRESLTQIPALPDVQMCFPVSLQVENSENYA